VCIGVLCCTAGFLAGVGISQTNCVGSTKGVEVLAEPVGLSAGGETWYLQGSWPLVGGLSREQPLRTQRENELLAPYLASVACWIRCMPP
jgi:hypothetical protein